ncbi:C6 finger domain-containing protein [Diplocarpon rosae]|nr:C6 finger domain-containing protein [Diplocarpon rosae]
MLGFSIAFVVAEVIPLFLITLFTVIAYDLGAGEQAIWLPPPRVNALGLSKGDVLRRIDFAGAFLAIAGVTLFLVGLNWGNQPYPWSSAHVVACLTIGLGLLGLFGVYEKFGATYPLFPGALVQHRRLFVGISFLCLTSGVNFIPVYTVYGASFRDAGIYLLPIGFCIAGGAIISAVLMTVFQKGIPWILLFFCVIQTVGLGSMAAIDPDDITTAWAPLVIGLLGVGGVLLPSQVVFSIISPDELIGTSIALSIVIRSLGQVIGVSMFYNLFHQHIQHLATTNLQIFSLPAIVNGFDPGRDPVGRTTELITTLTAGPFAAYAHRFNITDPANIAAIQQAGHNLYKSAFPELYLVSIAFGGAAIMSCFFLAGYVLWIDRGARARRSLTVNYRISEFINDNVAVHL